jgi:hypothetical protein
MPPNDVYILRWKAEIDQLLTGLNRRDSDAEERARKMLALIATEGTPDTVTSVFAALAAYWERLPLATTEP